MPCPRANTLLGIPVDTRDYAPAGALLHRLGVHRVRLMTNNPEKAEALHRTGIAVAGVVAVRVAARPKNQHYLDTKRRRLGHDLPLMCAGLHVVPDPATRTSSTEGSRAC